MSRPGCGTMTSRRTRTGRMVLIGLILLALLDTVSGVPYKRSLLRLCSKSLSDALALACKDRGYNEPFSYSAEADPQDSMEPGLVEECCYRQCSFSHLQQYCKQDTDSPVGALDNSVWIVNLPYSSGRPETSSEEISRSDTNNVTGTIKCNIHGLKGTRKKGTNTYHDDCVGCDGKVSARRHRGGRHRRQRRRRLGKVPDKAPVDGTPENGESKGSPFP
ncbi:insulin-like growth factor I [Hylaeus anthracinus]|uniref:insulin-like growth factor I n=1 Tax=Hylaeus volcanicus TaxID=313075 RepID=UPI0023B7DEE1|nr:insulin-like growth factor I [Hylaeus volcanicus]XP_054004634.1 insulin-like growth factor I [Hylaeus anthracinus]